MRNATLGAVVLAVTVTMSDESCATTALGVVVGGTWASPSAKSTWPAPRP